MTDFDANFDENFALENLNAREYLDSSELLKAEKVVAARSPAAHSFVERFQNMDGLSYQQATGYWANRYVPGDRAMRRLEAQLRSRNPQALNATLKRNAQPFDAPETPRWECICRVPGLPWTARRECSCRWV